MLRYASFFSCILLLITHSTTYATQQAAVTSIISNFLLDSKFTSYYLHYGFEDNNNPVELWTKTSTMLNNPVINYSYDYGNFTEGKRSLRIKTHIAGLADTNKDWYYYLKLPINPIANADGKLTFSADVMVDNASKDHVKIGFNKNYYTISESGVFSLGYIEQANQWVKIKDDTLAKRTRDTTRQSMEDKWLYDGSLDEAGVALNYIGILVYGSGPLDLDIRIDNITLSGTQTPAKTFTANYTKKYQQYIARVAKAIEQRKNTFAHLPADINTQGLSLCSKQSYFVDKLAPAKNNIQSILNTMTALNSSQSGDNFFGPQLMADLDIKLVNYQRMSDLLSLSLSNNDPILASYQYPSMTYTPLDGYNFYSVAKDLNSFQLRMTPGEYQSIAMVIDPVCTANKRFSLSNTQFTGAGANFAANNLDNYVAKLWYQAGLTDTVRRGTFLTPELLLKDEDLIRVRFADANNNAKNELRVTDIASNISRYIDISSPNASFPDMTNDKFDDATQLQTFAFDDIRYKLFWSILHIPENTPSGHYTSQINIKDNTGKILKSIPADVEVLPFKLDPSKLDYSLYYTGKLVDNARPIKSQEKTAAQQKLELQDMKDHGVLYPTSYDSYSKLAQTLSIRNEVGLPNDRFYSLGLRISDTAERINNAQNILSNNGYNASELYVYGIDEANPAELQSEIPDIIKVHNAGAKVFTAGYDFTYNILGDYLDHLNYAHGTLKADSATQVANWHRSGAKLFNYATPQVGVENPEVYRRNFGCKLWQQGFDGAMNWAYQYERGAFWNDFDINTNRPSNYREETFTYPTSNGIVGTIAWEGFREAITDVRYISTLLNIRDQQTGNNRNQLNQFINNIDCSADLYDLRNNIIDKILQYR